MLSISSTKLSCCLGALLMLQISILYFQGALPFPKQDVHLKFIGEKGLWLFVNPGQDLVYDTVDDIHINNDAALILPKNSRVYIDMISKDRIYCLDIDELGIVEYAIPGLTFNFQMELKKQDGISIESGPMCGSKSKVEKEIILVTNIAYNKWLTKIN